MSRLSNSLPNKSKATKLNTFIKLLRQLFSQHNHLAQYLELMTETTDKRVLRLMNDPSCQFEEERASIKDSILSRLFPNLEVFHPIEPIMLVWYLCVFLSIMYYYIEMGIVLTFGEAVWEEEMNNITYIILDVLTGLVLLFDIFVGLNSGYLYRGMIVMDRKRVTSRYITTYLFIDIVSVLVVFICPITKSFYLNYSKLWLILKIGRLFQIDDFYLRKLNIYRRSKAVYVVFKLMVIIFILSHVVGLIFYAIDFQLCSSGHYETQYCWLYVATAYSPIIELDYRLQYLYTLYWGINTITTISYGDIAPMNPIETNYATVCFCFGFMVYGYVSNQVVKIILWAREHEDEFKGELILMDTYMKKMKISRELRKNVHDYLEFLFLEEKNRDLDMEAKMIDKIPEELRIELLKNAYGDFYDRMLGIFFTPDIIRIFFYLTEKKFTHHEPIFNQGERPTSLFYLSKGKVDFIVKHGSEITKIYSTESNELIGQYEVFIKERRMYSAITTVSSLIYSIERSKLIEEINSKAKLRERLKLIEYNILFMKECKMIMHSCFFCNLGHNFHECPEKFPIFSIDKIDQQKMQLYQEEEHERLLIKKTNALTFQKELKNFRNFKSKENDRLITKVEKRLTKIKRKIDKEDKEFEIDVAHDWEVYYPSANFSRIREIWNSGRSKTN